MFKAKLIENNSYYSLKSKELWIGVVSASIMGMLVHVFTLPVWVAILIFILFIIIVFLQKKNFARMAQTVGKRMIEIDEQEIRIKSKNKMEQSISLSEVDRLVIKEEYKIHGEKINEVGQQLKGKILDNYIIIHANNEEKRFEFELDSHYMITQLNKITDAWSALGYKVEVLGKAGWK